MIKQAAEWLIDCVVVLFLIVLGLFIAGIGFFLYPFKKIRYFCGKKAICLVNTADYFLNESEEVRDE